MKMNILTITLDWITQTHTYRICIYIFAYFVIVTGIEIVKILTFESSVRK